MTVTSSPHGEHAGTRARHTASTINDADLDALYDTNRRLNLRAQQLESELATYRKAVGEWKISDHRAYVPLHTLAAIAKAAGLDVPGRWEQHYQRVKRAEAVIARVRHLHRPVGVVAAAEFGEPPDCATCGPNSWPCQTYNAVTEPEPTGPAATQATERPTLRERHHAQWIALTDAERAARIAELDEYDEPDAALAPAEETRLAQSGVDTPGCTCGHRGMGISWHGDDCPWRAGILDRTADDQRRPLEKGGEQP